MDFFGDGGVAVRRMDEMVATIRDDLLAFLKFSLNPRTEGDQPGCPRVSKLCVDSRFSTDKTRLIPYRFLVDLKVVKKQCSRSAAGALLSLQDDRSSVDLPAPSIHNHGLSPIISLKSF